jgi:hypothetical protein
VRSRAGLQTIWPNSTVFVRSEVITAVHIRKITARNSYAACIYAAKVMHQCYDNRKVKTATLLSNSYILKDRTNSSTVHRMMAFTT